MRIKFLGTAANEGFPALFCECENCNNVRKLGDRNELRTRSQVLIDGILSIDFPPEAYTHALFNGLHFSKLKYLLVTHSHMDHFYAHDFILRGYKYAQNLPNTLEIYGNSEVKAVFDECTAREMKPEVTCNIQIIEVKPYQKLQLGDYKVLTLLANHSKTEDALLFYIEKEGKGYLHFYDTAQVEDDIFKFLAENGAKVDAVCFDCTFIDATVGKVSRHMGIGDGMLMKDKLIEYGLLQPQAKVIISHFSHNSNPLRSKLRQIEKDYGVTAAYDGFTVEI